MCTHAWELQKTYKLYFPISLSCHLLSVPIYLLFWILLLSLLALLGVFVISCSHLYDRWIIPMATAVIMNPQNELAGGKSLHENRDSRVSWSKKVTRKTGNTEIMELGTDHVELERMGWQLSRKVYLCKKTTQKWMNTHLLWIFLSQINLIKESLYSLHVNQSSWTWCLGFGDHICVWAQEMLSLKVSFFWFTFIFRGYSCAVWSLQLLNAAASAVGKLLRDSPLNSGVRQCNFALSAIRSAYII